MRIIMLSVRRHGSAAIAAACLLVATTVHAAPPAYKVVDRISGADGGWDFANIASANGTLYVARSNAVMAMDIATRKVTDVLTPAQGSHQVLPIDNGKTVVQTDGKTGLTRFIDTASGRVLAQVPSGNKPDAAFFDAATDKVAVMSPGNDTITTIDTRTRKVVGTMKLVGGLEFAVTNGKGGAFINLEDAAKIAEVDLTKGRLLRKIDLPGCEGPTGLVRFAHGTRLISACANGVALVIDTASGKTLTTLPIGKDADAVLLDEARGLAFIPCGGSGTLIALSIADTNHVSIAQIIPTQVGAKTGAVDPRDGRIYLPTATLAPPEPGAKRGKPLPGTFVILVIAPQA
jgi:DNA-binding beta-propeller fold protein YncE